MIWNRDLAGFFVASLMITTLVFLLLKRKNLEKGITYLIAAIAVLTVIEVYSLFGKHFTPNYNSTILYVIGVNLIVFLLFFLFFHQLLVSKAFKNINMALIFLFLLDYTISALTDENFFTHFPYLSYFVQIVLLLGSIYLVMSQTFNSNKILNLKGYFPFWVCISLLVLYPGVLPLLIVSFTAKSLMNLNIFFTIIFIVNSVGYLILLYGLFNVKSKL